MLFHLRFGDSFHFRNALLERPLNPKTTYTPLDLQFPPVVVVVVFAVFAVVAAAIAASADAHVSVSFSNEMVPPFHLGVPMIKTMDDPSDWNTT